MVPTVLKMKNMVPTVETHLKLNKSLNTMYFPIFISTYIRMEIKSITSNLHTYV